jgi:hypothetical protein
MTHYVLHATLTKSFPQAVVSLELLIHLRNAFGCDTGSRC